MPRTVVMEGPRPVPLGGVAGTGEAEEIVRLSVGAEDLGQLGVDRAAALAVAPARHAAGAGTGPAGPGRSRASPPSPLGAPAESLCHTGGGWLRSCVRTRYIRGGPTGSVRPGPGSARGARRATSAGVRASWQGGMAGE